MPERYDALWPSWSSDHLPYLVIYRQVCRSQCSEVFLEGDQIKGMLIFESRRHEDNAPELSKHSCLLHAPYLGIPTINLQYYSLSKRISSWPKKMYTPYIDFDKLIQPCEYLVCISWTRIKHSTNQRNASIPLVIISLEPFIWYNSNFTFTSLLHDGCMYSTIMIRDSPSNSRVQLLFSQVHRCSFTTHAISHWRRWSLATWILNARSWYLRLQTTSI